MKKIILIIISLLFYNNGLSQNLKESDLVGEWEFIELQDENGDKQTKIPLIRFGRDMGIENVNRDSYIFKEDGTYKSFNPLNVSVGTWYFDKKTKDLVKNETGTSLCQTTVLVSPDSVSLSLTPTPLKVKSVGPLIVVRT